MKLHFVTFSIKLIVIKWKFASDQVRILAGYWHNQSRLRQRAKKSHKFKQRLRKGNHSQVYHMQYYCLCLGNLFCVDTFSPADWHVSVSIVSVVLGLVFFISCPKYAGICKHLYMWILQESAFYVVQNTCHSNSRILSFGSYVNNQRFK